jgi:glycine cleavage system aminomethyltransferase T
MPIQYKGISIEHQAVRERAGLFDVSHMGELELRGDKALELVNSLVTNDIARAADGQATYTCCCNERATILDDLIVYRRAPNDVLVPRSPRISQPLLAECATSKTSATRPRCSLCKARRLLRF